MFRRVPCYLRPMPSPKPNTSTAHRLTAAAIAELVSMREGLERPRPIPPGAFEGEIWRGLKTLAHLASIPIDAAFEAWRASIRSAATRCKTPVHLAQLTWPPVAFADRRMRWIAGELGRQAVDAVAAREAIARARELPPGAVARRILAPPRGERAKPGEAPECDPARAAELDRQFSEAFGGDA